MGKASFIVGFRRKKFNQLKNFHITETKLPLTH
jgi:hypothetical protein